MSSPPPPDPDGEPPARPWVPAWRQFADAPLAPVAVAATLGLVADRYAALPAGAALFAAATGVAGFLVGGPHPRVWLALVFFGLAAAYHHQHRHDFPPDDIGRLAAPEPRLARLRGWLCDDPATRLAPRGDPLEPRLRGDSDSVTVEVTARHDGTGWVPATGKVRVTVARDSDAVGAPPLAGLRAGDQAEFVGLIVAPGPPRNPGEFDYGRFLADQRVRALLHLTQPAAATRLAPDTGSLAGLLAATRRAANDTLLDRLPPRQARTAAALLLGDNNAMEQGEWQAYIRTGVVHALAISGQHLAVLAGFLWLALRALGVRRRRGALLVLAVVAGYALLTGLRPSGLRAAVMVGCVCGGLLLRRPAKPANTFALSWLAVIALNPADVFTLGCQLSFLAVFVLIWSLGPALLPRPRSAIDQLIHDSRPVATRAAIWAGHALWQAYLITLVLGAVNTPILLAQQNLVSPVGLVIGPAVVVLTSVALLAGFTLLLVGSLPLLAPLASVAAVPTRYSLWACERVVSLADALPGGSVYLPPPSPLWQLGFYAGVVAAVLAPRLYARRILLALAAWVAVGLALPPGHTATPGELRVTFLAVGKGGCVVLETPDGRCLLYDVGTTAGPAAVRRVVAPFLWSRGISRVDELFLSHADYDHFNGVAELCRRFPVAQATLTPTFKDKPTVEVEGALAALKRKNISTRLGFAGKVFDAGGVTLEVLHPPPEGPPGSENERSLVLLVRHRGHTILLTGDLEKRGTEELLAQPPRECHVLMAPHHGSRAALPPALIAWGRPRLMVASRGPALGNTVRDTTPPTWDTFTHGAVTLASDGTGLVAESFRTGERAVLVRGAE